MPLVVPSESGDNPCGSCSMLYGASCCELKGGGPLFPMTYGEAFRIARARRSSIKQCVNIREVSEDEQTALRGGAGSEFADLVVGGVGLYLPRSPSGACVYLKGLCSIPNYKPYVCATFPFKWNGRRWTIGMLAEPSFCFGQDISTSLRGALKIFGESVKNLNGLRAQYEKDQKTHKAMMRALKRRRK